MWLRNRTAPRLRLLRNETQDLPGKHAFATFRLQGTATNRDAIGARVEVHLEQGGSGRVVQTLSAGDSFLSQSSKWLHFGLGDHQGPFTVSVRWPGGETERFEELAPGHFFELTEGSGRAVEWTPPARELALEADVAEEGAATRLDATYLERIPMPALPFTPLDEESSLSQPQAIPSGDGPTLVLLWASWCAPCLGEMRELATHAPEIQAAGLNIHALSIDGLDPNYETGPEDARRMLERLAFPFPAGVADISFLNKVEKVQKLVFSRTPTFGVPTSYLLDEDGALAAIYRGRVDPETLLRDAHDLQTLTSEEWDARSSPMQGRWLAPVPPFDPRSFADAFETEFPGDTEHFLQLAIEQGTALLNSNVERSDERTAILRQNLALTQSRLASIQYGRGKSKAAIETLKAALQMWPDFARAHSNLAVLLRQEGQLDEAISHLREALRIDPLFSEARGNLTNALNQRGVKIGSQQLVRKLQQLGAGFGLDPKASTSPAQFRELVESIVRRPDTIASGTFRRQGLVDFFVRGRNVVVSKDGKFLTVLKDGVDTPSVQNALGQ